MMETSLTRISGKNGLAEAVRYALPRWTALSLSSMTAGSK